MMCNTNPGSGIPVVTPLIRFFVLLGAVWVGYAHAQVPAPPDPLSLTGSRVQDRFDEIEIVQNLNAQVPLDLSFVDEQGEAIAMRDMLNGKALVLSLVFYE